MEEESIPNKGTNKRTLSFFLSEPLCGAKERKKENKGINSINRFIKTYHA
jgi:hypothetical protein